MPTRAIIIVMRAKDHIYKITAYPAGQPIEGGAKLASNENPFGCSALAKQAFIEAADDLNIYPDAYCTQLRKAIAEHENLNFENIICSAGSDEMLGLIASAYLSDGDEVIMPRYSFLKHKLFTLSAGATPVLVDENNYHVDFDGLLNAITGKTKIIFLANPNNPTGTYKSAHEVQGFIDQVPKNILIVLDAAYCEVVQESDYGSGLELAKKHKNIIILRTFSKVYGLAALRIGWGYMDEEIIDALNRIRPTFSVTNPSQKAAIAALDDTDFVARSVAHMNAVRDDFLSFLDKKDIGYIPSVCNFFLVDCQTAEKAVISHDRLLTQKISVRPVNAYGLNKFLRISVGTTQEMMDLKQIFGDHIVDIIKG